MKGHSCFEGTGLNDIYNKVMDEFDGIEQEQGSQFGKTLELMNCFIKIEDPRRRFVIVPERKHSLAYLAGELVWYFSGERHVDRIHHYSKFWDKLVDREGNVNSNYGEKIFYRSFVDEANFKIKSQFDFVVDELKRDCNSRRAVLFLTFADDYVTMHNTKDFPCTTNMHFLIRDGKLDVIVHMRSNDFILGFTNDMPFFSILQEMIAAELGVPLGTYYHFSDSMHLYERNYDLLEYRRACDPIRERPFPVVTPRDVAGIRKWANFETDIRTCPHDFDDRLLEFCPPFTHFIFRTILDHWRSKH